MPAFLQRNPAIAVVLAIVAIVAAGVIIMRTHGAASVVAPDQAYFYSLQSGELFSAAYDSLPPVEAPNGGEGVRAYVYSCGACDAAERFTAYLETYPAAAKASLISAKAAGNFDKAGEIMATERQVAAPPEGGAEPEWLSAASPQAQRIMNAHRGKCGEATPVACGP